MYITYRCNIIRISYLHSLLPELSVTQTQHKLLNRSIRPSVYVSYLNITIIIILLLIMIMIILIIIIITMIIIIIIIPTILNNMNAIV